MAKRKPKAKAKTPFGGYTISFQGTHGDAGGAVRRRRDPAVRHDEEALGLREEEPPGDEGVDPPVSIGRGR